LVLDYIDGAALDRVIRKGGPLSPGAVALIGREVGKALDAVHTMRDGAGNDLHVVHRDVSPANILIGRDGRIRLSDFGVARIHGLGGEKTETGVFKGKLPYMPPEQALGEPFDGRADIFSLGVTLFEALIGGRLRKAETQGQLIAMIATDRVPRIGTMLPHLMVELQQAIDGATEFKAHARVPSAGHLAGQLHNVLYNLGPGAEEAAIHELCQRVSDVAGAGAPVTRQPWSMALTGENAAYATGPRTGGSGQSISSASHASGPHSVRTSPSVPPDASASVTRVASISDANRPAPPSNGRMWFVAICGAVMLGSIAGAMFVLFGPSPQKPQPTSEIVSIAATSTPASAPLLTATAPSAEPASSAASSALAVGSSSSVPSSKASVTRVPGPTVTTPTSTSGGEESGTGTLIVAVNPWGNVSVDGASKGTTPIGAITLPAGTHTVVVTNPELGASRSATVKIVGGKSHALRFDLKKSD
ncbi:MAG: serine/threonine protein kinase, partial [Myxococcales bacterium]|nr:serine/threonine protein kinase [Myxococcales bacterium]